VTACGDNSAPLVQIPADDLERIRGFYDRGLYLQAYHAAAAIAPLDRWTGGDALVLGARLAGNLGASRVARGLILRARRRDKSRLDILFFYLVEVLRQRGPLNVWRYFESTPIPTSAPPAERAELLSLRARVTATFRDFETAERLLTEAEQIDPQNRWVQLERSFLLEERDEYDAALSASQEVLAAHPWYRPAVQAVAHHLQLLSRDEEAVQLLLEAMQHIESGAVAAQLALAQSELRLYADELQTLQRFRELSPLLDGRDEEWWHSAMSDVQYHLGNIQAAAEHARLVKGAFFERIAKRLAEPAAEPRRVHLPVAFVRQHRMTCAPATISALSRFWEMPVDHLSLAAAICYDGTPAHIERHWLEQNGWCVREFRFTWDAATALLDRGVPFTVTTVEIDTAHLQAVVGYDALRRTLLIRDPYLRVHSEFDADLFAERYAASGPRAMVLLPRANADALDGIALPDVELFDRYYELRRALETHDRATAGRIAADLQNSAPAHRLAIESRRSLAIYDCNEADLLPATEELLRQFPEHSGFLALSKLTSLRELARRRDAIEFLKEKTSTKEPAPEFLREHARELLEDASQRATTRRLLMRAARIRPVDADMLHVFAGLHWEERDWTRSAQLYRLAACVGDKTEYLFRSFFRAARQIGRGDEVLAWLRRRFDEHGRKSNLPARTLFWALQIIDRTPDALEVLDTAIRFRPDDGELLAWAASELAWVGQGERAAELLHAAEGRAPRGAWLRTSAAIAENQSELADALTTWREVLTIEPLAMDAHRAFARLTAEVEGREVALRRLQAICTRFPHHVPLHKLWLEWTREHDQREKILRTLVEISPEDAWSRRELALLLSDTARFDEAHRQLRIASTIEPAIAATHTVTGVVLEQEGRTAEARESLKEALRLSIDADAAIHGLLRTCSSVAEKREALQFIFAELKQQVSFGDGLLAYRGAAYPLLDAQELLAHLREALAARPDLWHAWSAVVAQLVAMNQLEEALTTARAAAEQFPLLPRIWFDLAGVHKARLLPAEEIPPLRRALELSPGWGLASRELAAAHGRLGQVDEAMAVLEKAIAATPSDPFNRGSLAELRWRKGDRAAALAEVQRAVILDPDYDWAWQALRDWSSEEGGENHALAAARELVARRGGESRAWLRLADALQGREHLIERLDAVERALALNRRRADAWDAKATVLAELGRYSEALDACAPAVFGYNVPASLRGRAAWIEAQRGQLDAAIEKMNAVVAEVPDYWWAWARLADWHMERGDAEQALAAAEQMSRLDPLDVTVLGYIGDARLALGRVDEAHEALRRAWDLDPQYTFGAHKLLDAQLQKRDFGAAETTVEKMRRHLSEADSLFAEVKLAAARDEKQRALRAAEQLARCKGEIGFHLFHVSGVLNDAGWNAEAESRFAKIVRDQSANPLSGALWAKQLGYRSWWHWWRAAILQLQTRTPAGLEALRAFIDLIGSEKRRWLVRFVVWRFADAIRADDLAAGNVSYAAANSGLLRLTVRFMRDWETRPGVQPWMLHNYAEALLALGRDEEARNVRTAAVALPADHTTNADLLYLALEEALAGDISAAERTKAAAATHKKSEHTEALVTMLDALLEFHRAPAEQRGQAAKTASEVLRAEFAQAPPDNAMRRLYRRTLLHLARETNNRLAVIGAWLRTLPRPQPFTSYVLRVVIVFSLIFWRAWVAALQALTEYVRNLFGL
jgi:cellulose synthase operon protein C